MKKTVLIFTKTIWEEPARIRHQVARLLNHNGYDVIFFEKNSIKNFCIKYKKVEGIKFFSHFELIHHQLRINSIVFNLNNKITKYFLKRILADIDPNFIFNFNYDYFFLKELFPDKRVITLINDDFIAVAKPWARKSAKLQLKKTCENSDFCLAVSSKLCKMLSEYNTKSEVFLPWSSKEYSIPDVSGVRDTVLYWGYVNNRIDWDVLIYLLENNIKIRIIGPVAKKAKFKINGLKKYKNLSLLKTRSANEIDFSDVCCSLLAYNLSKDVAESITINNRAFQLLSYGIPLIYSALPNLIKAPKDVISICNTKEEFIKSVEFFKGNFNKVQNSILKFLPDHYLDKRILQLEKILVNM